MNCPGSSVSPWNAPEDSARLRAGHLLAAGSPFPLPGRASPRYRIATGRARTCDPDPCGHRNYQLFYRGYCGYPPSWGCPNFKRAGRADFRINGKGGESIQLGQKAKHESTSSLFIFVRRTAYPARHLTLAIKLSASSHHVPHAPRHSPQPSQSVAHAHPHPRMPGSRTPAARHAPTAPMQLVRVLILHAARLPLRARHRARHKLAAVRVSLLSHCYLPSCYRARQSQP